MTTLTATPQPATASIAVEVSPTPSIDYAWTGAANASTSTRTVNGVLDATNRHTNPRPVGAPGWFLWTGAAVTLSTVISTAADGPEGRQGYRSSTVTAVSSGGTGVLVGQYTQGSSGVAGAAGARVPVSMWVRYTKARKAFIAGQPRLAGAYSGAVSNGPLVDVPANTWTRLSVDVVATASFDDIQVGGFAATSEVWVVGDKAEAGSVMLAAAGGYFDGAVPDQAAGGAVTALLRSDANGTHPVRTQAGVLPIVAPTVVVDHEAALVGTVTYTAVDGAAGASVVTALDLDVEWLTVPATPAVSVPLPELGRLDYAATRRAATIVHDVIDRADQPVTLGPLRLRAGSFDIWCPDHATARTIEATYARQEVVFLRQTIPGMDLYHAVLDTAVRLAASGFTRWILSVSFQEVAWPTGDQVGTLGWSIDDVTASYSTIASVALEFDTINDLTIGPVP